VQHVEGHGRCPRPSGDGAGVEFSFVTIANLVGPPNLTLARHHL